MPRCWERADAWDHVVSINNYNATNLLQNPKLKLLGYKTGLFDRRRDVDPAAVRAVLPGPGEMIIVDDPRVAARALKRPPYQPVPLSKGLCVHVKAETLSSLPTSTNSNLHGFFHSLGVPTRERVLILLAADFPGATQTDGDATYQRRRTEKIAERAWAAQAAGSKRKTAQLVALLEAQVRHRSLHKNLVLSWL